ncbi:MAG: putative synthase YscN [Candidatus Hydrogenedentota bacterium]|jgi:flagellum-specific ATP synthase
MAAPVSLERYERALLNASALRVCGRITSVVGLTILATGPRMSVGDLCHVRTRDTGELLPLEVVGFREGEMVLMPLGVLHGIAPGLEVKPTHKPRTVPVGEGLLGRVVNSMGQPIDGRPLPVGLERAPLHAAPPPAMSRQRIAEPLPTGVRAIDACITAGRGQRMAILSGSGVGKSKLMGMITRGTSADVCVVGLIGERGREVREFIENDLGPEGLARSVVVAATSDEPALLRLSGAFTATAIAEWFRDQGLNVMLMMDSLTRFAMAQREVGLAVGEPPTTKGYPPSVYALLPQVLERAGNSDKGSITAFYTVLVEADDLNDPIGDAVRSIADGHIALSRELSTRGHYPPVSVLDSVSRSMTDVATREHLERALEMRRLMAAYRDAEDLINIGAYVPGSNAEIDRSMRLMPQINRFLRQGLREHAPFESLPGLMQQALTG